MRVSSVSETEHIDYLISIGVEEHHGITHRVDGDNNTVYATPRLQLVTAVQI